MTGSLEELDNASTPFSDEELVELIPSYITLRRELNEAEQGNILEAEYWALKRKRNVLNERFLNNLHKRMYGRVWRWAGKYRRTGKNIGVEAYRIPLEIGQLLDDCRYWIEHKVYETDESAARFHHGLVWIHPYPNGNGRHARLAADLALVAQGRPRFTWGSINLIDPGEARQHYIMALRAADGHDYGPLLEFVRSSIALSKIPPPMLR